MCDIYIGGTASSSSEDDDILNEAIEMMEFVKSEEAELTSAVSASCEEGDMS